MSDAVDALLTSFWVTKTRWLRCCCCVVWRQSASGAGRIVMCCFGDRTFLLFRGLVATAAHIDEDTRAAHRPH